MPTWKRPVLFPLLFIAMAAASALVVMLLWNAIIPDLTGWAALTYWKALGLLVLCRVLFGGSRGRTGGVPKHNAPWRARWKSMSTEERAAMKERLRERCQQGEDPRP